MDEKQLFLYRSALLYKRLVELTEHDCLRRFLAFKVIVNAMAFEDTVGGERQFREMREIRDVFLAHKQKSGFWEGFGAAERITSRSISVLVDFMASHCGGGESLDVEQSSLDLAESVLKAFETEFYSGPRLSNNFLCCGAGQVKEVGDGGVQGVFFRFNSSLELAILANYLISNLHEKHGELLFLNPRIDYVLHIVNLHDCIYRDHHNRYSMDGLLEVLQKEGIGSPASLESLQTDRAFSEAYRHLRCLRNKVAAHMDRSMPLDRLLAEVRGLDMETAFEFERKLLSAVEETARTHPAIEARLFSNTRRLPAGCGEVRSDVVNVPYS